MHTYTAQTYMQDHLDVGRLERATALAVRLKYLFKVSSCILHVHVYVHVLCGIACAMLRYAVL